MGSDVIPSPLEEDWNLEPNVGFNWGAGPGPGPGQGRS